MTVVIGVVLYAKYYNCDPMLTGRVTRVDQLLPFFVLDIFENDYPGVPGLFVACIFGSSLSTLSSGLNAMATIVWDDYGKRLLYRLPTERHVFATKGIAILIGLLAIVFAFIVKGADSIVDAAIMIYGATNGPMFGLFVLGLFCPWANAIGSASALITGQLISLWIVIGSVSDKRDPLTKSLALSTDACADMNITVYIPGAPLSIMKDYKIPDYYPTGFTIFFNLSFVSIQILTFF
jgi:Na+/proline symporter